MLLSKQKFLKFQKKIVTLHDKKVKKTFFLRKSDFLFSSRQKDNTAKNKHD